MSKSARATAGRNGAGSTKSPSGERASISPSVKSSSRSPGPSLPRARTGSTPRPRGGEGSSSTASTSPAGGQQHRRGVAAGDDVEAAVVLDVDEDPGHEVLGVGQVGQDPPVDLAGHVRDVAGAGGRGPELAEHHGGGADGGEPLAAHVADQQPHARRAADDLVEVAADLGLDRRRQVAGRQRDRAGPRGRGRQDRALGRLGDQGDPGQPLGLLLERGRRVERDRHPVGDRLEEGDVLVAVATARLGVDQRQRPDDAVATGQRRHDRAGQPEPAQHREVVGAGRGRLDQLGGDERVDLAPAGADHVGGTGGGVHAGREGAHQGARPLGGLGVAVLHRHGLELAVAQQLQGAPVGEAGHEEPAHLRHRRVQVEAARQGHRRLGQQGGALGRGVLLLELRGAQHRAGERAREGVEEAVLGGGEQVRREGERQQAVRRAVAVQRQQVQAAVGGVVARQGREGGHDLPDRTGSARRCPTAPRPRPGGRRRAGSPGTGRRRRRCARAR